VSRLNAQAGNRKTRITTATTTVVKNGTGILHRIVVAVAVASTITINESLAGVSTVVAVLPASFPVGSYEFNMELAGKIEIVTAGASDLLIIWS
jgi:hypothetical protein